jgi:hypothetical protein
MTAINATAGLAVSTNAINATSFASSNAVGAALNVRNTVTSSAGSVQQGALAANLTASAKTGARTAQMYSLLQTTLAAQNDAVEVLGYLLAVTAASRCANKYETATLIAQVEEIATHALEEIYGLRPMPLHRPDSDQLSELIRAATAARSLAGLNALPSLH